MTTLHGTDITLVGSDPSYAWVVGFSIERSHVVTAVSQSLKADTIASLGIRHSIEVIPNFLDCEEYQRRPDPAFRKTLCADDAAPGRPYVELPPGQARGHGGERVQPDSQGVASATC